MTRSPTKNRQSKSQQPKILRCAVYTRKSTDHNLDMAFNSLDAQREACEAYIKSQQHEGWSLVQDQYDDGAFSGASLDRPALQQLLQSVRDGRIDIIVLYKVDRLTRSLADFAKLVELFDEKSVSFVSVTQSFNTTSSMGRLTLNVLLSFAQFEREVIGERVRDKIAASKKKGIWVGGTIPLGYRSVNKKLEIIPEEAELVRRIYSLYLEAGSIADLAKRLNDEGLKPKPRQLSNGRRIEPDRYRPGPLAHILKNRFYIGEVVYQGETNPGEHPAIIDRKLFEAVQEKLAAARIARTNTLAKSKHILRGLIFDDRDNRMTPSHSNKKDVRYRYYVSNPVLHKQHALAGSITRIPAPDVESLVLDAVAKEFGIADNGSTDWRQQVLACIRRVVVHKDRLVVTCLSPQDINTVDDGTDQPGQREDGDGSEERNEQQDMDAVASEDITLTVPCSFPAQTKRKGIASLPDHLATIDPARRDTLLIAIARSRQWIADLTSGQIASFEDIAHQEGKVVRHIHFLAPLAFVSPKIIKAIMQSDVPADLTVSSLSRNLPHDWSEQERRLGLV